MTLIALKFFCCFIIPPIVLNVFNIFYHTPHSTKIAPSILFIISLIALKLFSCFIIPLIALIVLSLFHYTAHSTKIAYNILFIILFIVLNFLVVSHIFHSTKYF